MTALRRLALKTLRGVAVAYLLVLLLMTCFERWLVYPSPSVERSDWSPGGVLFEDINFPSTDGTPLHGWFLEHSAPDRAVLYLHGNGAQVADMADVLPILSSRLQASVFIVDYRGYGKSGGKPFEAGIVEDGLAAQRWLAERTGRQPDEVVLVGQSLGGGVATACAAKLGAKALVLQNTFSRLTDAAAHHYPWLPVRLLMRNRYDSIERIAQYDGPVFSSHGTADRVVPFEQGRQLFNAAPGANKQFYEISGGGHNTAQPGDYYDQLAAFLDAIE